MSIARAHRPLRAAVGLVLMLQAVPPAQASPLPDAPGCPMFPRTSVWHTDISSLPVHPRSEAWLASMSAESTNLHPDFGPSFGKPQPYGIPYDVVDSSTPRVEVAFTYAAESDPGPYPIGDDTPIEMGSDRHALVVDRDSCTLYELFDLRRENGSWRAGSGAVWDLRSNALRPATWTSADAAGLPILPGLLRKDEVEAGVVDHAIRVTASRTSRQFLWPARHHAGATDDPLVPPMGARFRLRRSFDISGFRQDTQVVLRAMQRYGLILADNGSDWFFGGTSEEGWDLAMLDELKSVPAFAFVAVDASSLRLATDSGKARQPVRVSLAAKDARVPAGRRILLSAKVSPAHPGSIVTLERRPCDTCLWKRISERPLDDTSRVRFGLLRNERGRAEVRLVFARDGDHLGGRSGVRRIAWT